MLCSGHHAALHAGLLTMSGRAPRHIQFRWTCRAPIPVGLTAAEREQFCRQQDAELANVPLPQLPEEEVDELVFEWERRHSKSQLGRQGKRRPLPPVRALGVRDAGVPPAT